MSHTRCLCVLVLLALLLPAVSRGDDLLSRTVPGKWFEPMVPESDPEPFYPDYVRNDGLARAKAQVNAGQYRRALATIAKLDGAKSPLDVALVKAAAQGALGHEEEAIATLSEASVAGELPAEIMRADLLGQLEKYSDALALLQQIVKDHPESIGGHFYLGWYHEKSGDYDQALKDYQWFHDAPQSYVDRWHDMPKSFNSAADVVLIGRALDRWATLSGAYTQDQSLHNLILSMFTAAYHRIDTEYYPAHVAAAEYFLSHDDPNEAMNELSEALGVNPHDAATHALAGKVAVESFNFAATEGQMAAIRDANPDSVAADLLEVRDLLQQRRPEDALDPVNAVLARRPVPPPASSRPR